MIFIFYFLFLVGLGKRTWARNRSSIIIKGLEAMLTPKTVVNLSKAQRTASRTVLIKYTHQETEYEVVLPMRRRPLGWDRCVATMKDDSEQDITKDVLSRAGPHKDFFGAKLRAGQIYRNAKELKFYSPKKANPILVI